LDNNNFVTIYYDQLTDLFAIVDSKSNFLFDFGLATEVTYAEIFAYQSSGTLKPSEISLSLNQPLGEDSSFNPRTKSSECKEIEMYQEKYILSDEDAEAILNQKYGPNFIGVENNEFKIQDWQAAKKIEHAVCFGINPVDYDFLQAQAVEINDPKGGIVAYLRKGKILPRLDLIRAYQNAMKNFCEDRNRLDRNDTSTFRHLPLHIHQL
jgi:hypothetical protein